MIFVCGSINLDRVYALLSAPQAGETMAAQRFHQGIGGKGANQAIAAARAGASVKMIGTVGADGALACAALQEAGVDIAAVTQVDQPTGHAVILLEPNAENRIVIVAGANAALTADQIEQGLSTAEPGDILLLQNETPLSVTAAKAGQARDMMVIYSAAPFEADAVAEIMPHCDLIAMNEQEHTALNQAEIALICPALITLGADGVRALSADGQASTRIKAPKVTAVDTTGAGDCFIGHYAANLSQGRSRDTAMARATKAAALQVTRHGAAAAMPSAEDVDRFSR